MPGSKPEPRTLTADEQRTIQALLTQQRQAQDHLLATGLTRGQRQLLGRIFHTRLELHRVLALPESVIISGSRG